MSDGRCSPPDPGAGPAPGCRGRGASRRAGQQRVSEEHAGALEACGYELHRLYNVLEKSFERVCEAFENHFEKRGDYHEKLLERMTLDLPGVRPAFIAPNARDSLRELKSFRHLIRHVYDLKLRGSRLRELTEIAATVAADFPQWIEDFVQRVSIESAG